MCVGKYILDPDMVDTIQNQKLFYQDVGSCTHEIFPGNI